MKISEYPHPHTSLWADSFKEIYLSKALTCMEFFLNKQKMPYFIKETDTFGHIVV